jgi:hypothetical protein
MSRFVVLSVLALSLLTSGCKKKGPQTLRHEGTGVSLVMPGDFSKGSLSLDEQAKSKLQLQGYQLLKDVAFGVLSEAKVDLAVVPPLEKYVTMASASRAKLLGNMTIEPNVKKTIHGKSAIQHVVKGTVKNQKLVFVVAYVESDKYFHQVSAWTSPSHLDANLAIMQGIIDSFEVT